jgi:hypothetical protein
MTQPNSPSGAIARAMTTARVALLAAGLSVAGAAGAANCSDPPVSGNTYYIVNEGSGLQLEVSGWSKADGASVVQWNSTSGPYNFNQQWAVTDMGGGLLTLRPVHSDKSLDVYGWSKEDGSAVVQWSYTGNPNQQWKVSAAGGGAYKIKSNFSDKVLTVADTKAGTTLQQRSDQWSPQQKWYFNPVNGNCKAPAATKFSSFMGFTKVLVGAQMGDETPTKAPWDVRYRYLSSDAWPNAEYANKCPSGWTNWWACWDNTRPPGTQIKDWVVEGKSATWQGTAHPRMTMFTYYTMSKIAGDEGGDLAMKVINDSGKLTRYLNDWRFLLQKIGNERAILQIEPDMWGFLRGKNTDPRAIPAQVHAANWTDCSDKENNAAGLARCMISMARKYAPNATVGLHASPWSGTADDWGNYLLALGANEGDFFTMDVADRDAGWRKARFNQDTFWNDEKFAKFLALSKRLTEMVGKPMLVWQIPVGNWNQNNTNNHWQDNHVDYIFNNMEKVADAHIVGVFFGAGEGEQTSPETDGGYLIWKAQELHKKGGVSIR